MPGAPSALDALVTEIAAKLRQKDFPGAPVGPYMHGPNGLWSYPGLDNQVLSTRVLPVGLAGALPSRPTNVETPIYPFLTGFTDPAEINPEGPCDLPPTVGQMKNCFQFAQFGRYGYSTNPLDLSRLGQIINRSDFTDLVLANDPLGVASGVAGITIPSSTPSSLSLMNDVSARFAGVGVKFQQKLSNQLYEGNPANNTGGGGYAEFPGIDRLIRTGVRDAVTGQLCPSMDSLILDENYKKVSDSTGDDNIVNVFTYVMRYLRHNSSRMQLDPVQWAILMRQELFYELTAVWPCNYLTYRCVFPGQPNAGAENNLMVDARDALHLREAMREGSYLVIDGRRVPVIVDDAINEESSTDTNRVDATCFASDIKIVPLTVKGNIASLYWEYFDWRGNYAAMSQAVMGSSPLISNFFWSDGGQYFWHMLPPDLYCVQWTAIIKPRIILRTPFLAAAINNVQYCPLIHTRDSYPNDPYFVDGGVTSRTTAPSLYSSWTA